MATNTTLPTIDYTSLRTLDQIRSAYEALKVQEDQTERELESLLSSHRSIKAQLEEISESAAHRLAVAESEATETAKKIGHTASLADGVSAKVKQLDLAKSRVTECQRRVNDLIDLRLCSDGVKAALADEDYEKAAAHLHRFLSMDEALLKLTASQISYGNTEGLEAAIETLHGAKGRVKAVVSKRFDEAVIADDLGSIERFFKLFPLINMQDGGIEKFCSYMCGKIASTSKDNLKESLSTMPGDQRAGIIFADTLTLLFEGIARIVEVHQPLIETYYGPGRLTNVLILLQDECDAQAGKIFDEFRRKRAIQDKVDRVREASRRVALPISASSASLSGSSTGSGGPETRLQARELDHILEEMTLLQARSDMYFKFVRKKANSDIDVSTASDDARVGRDLKSSVERRLASSGLSKRVDAVLSDYILFEEFYMAQSVRKAFEQHDARPDDDKLLDDVFFIVKQCVGRAAGSGSVDVLCAVANNACSVLDAEFAAVLQSHVRMGFPSGYLDMTMNVIQTSLNHGYRKAAAQAAAGDTDRQKIVFQSSLNCVDLAADYIDRLTGSLRAELAPKLVGKNSHDKEKVENCLSGFASVTHHLKAVSDQGMQLLRQSVVKPRIKPWLDTFPGHDIDEDTFADYEANDPFIQSLIMNLDNLLGSFKATLSANNYDQLVVILSAEVTGQLEKAATKSRFSRLGGLLFDREVRALVSFLSSGTQWSIRDKFAKITQIATVLNLESVDEISDLQEQWQLSSNEIKQILNLRTDFNADEIRRLRL